MKWLKRLGLGIIVLLLLLGFISFYYYSSLKPDYNEKVSLPNLESKVDIYYDEYGIPHIYGQSIRDAYIALGYVHAKDRFWQMDILRRIAPGRLSELFGSSMVENDRFFRTIGIGQQSKKEAADFLARTNPDLHDMVLGYIEGINQFLASESTIEHQLLGLDPEPYTLEDVYNVMGYMAFSFSQAHKTEPITDFINNKLGTEYLQALDVHVAPGTEVIQSEIGQGYAPLSLHIQDLLEGLPAPELIGSNSWVLGASKTSTDGVLFANDPHIGYSQPSVWYEAHIEAPGISMYGNYIAGYPLAQVGHNRHHAIGLTMFENDDIDYYRERVNPDNPKEYWAVDKWTAFEERPETIKVKDGEDVSMTVRTTRHGPILSDVLESIDPDDPVSMWWVYQKFPIRLIEVSQLTLMANSLEEVRKGASMIHAPGLNVMYGDVEGNIAWWAAAKLPKRPAHVNSKLILDGASGADDITEFYEFNDNPQSVNPSSAFVYSANNQSVSHDMTRHPGYYLPEDRGRRIVELLKEKNDWSVTDIKKMLLDDISKNRVEIAQSLISSLHQNSDQLASQAIDKLRNWDGNYQVESSAPTIYTKLSYHILYDMMSDELGELWDVFNGTHLMKRSLQPLLTNDTTVWWDNTQTAKVENRKDIIQDAFNKTMSELSTQLGADINNWNWGKVHILEHEHAFNANATLAPYFNVGPFESSGGTDVINNIQFSLSGDGIYEAFAGPSCRRVIDLTNLENESWSILPTGQSGNVLSPFYQDQAEMYNKGEFRKQLMNKNEIIKLHQGHTTLSPL